jgi:hypothetical protein
MIGAPTEGTSLPGRIIRATEHLLTLALGLALLAAGVTAQRSAAAQFENWYPRDIQPPPGTRYPCALTALPVALPGIPPDDHRFINHSYTLILRATQAKLLMLKALDQGHAEPQWGTYQRDTSAALRALRAEPVPAGLEAFRDRVADALELQMTFFEKALEARRHGQTMTQVFAIPEGRAASARLQAAWSTMVHRYPAWATETRQSIYHHLCALDLF